MREKEEGKGSDWGSQPKYRRWNDQTSQKPHQTNQQSKYNHHVTQTDQFLGVSNETYATTKRIFDRLQRIITTHELDAALMPGVNVEKMKEAEQQLAQGTKGEVKGEEGRMIGEE